jgi:hypothetical protein
MDNSPENQPVDPAADPAADPAVDPAVEGAPFFPVPSKQRFTLSEFSPKAFLTKRLRLRTFILITAAGVLLAGGSASYFLFNYNVAQAAWVEQAELNDEVIEKIAEDIAAAADAAERAADQAAADAEAALDASYLEQGYYSWGDGLYYRWADPSEFTCDYFSCLHVYVTTSYLSCSSVYVEASILSGSVNVGYTNDSTGYLGAGQTAELTLTDTSDGGNVFSITEINCW